ncbi:unnamed protein product [Orchesella dallaii]|uniref:Uncharacterized protein n=1 Tax=Orchesella dallaii TaxID=48710 RepID=A0ABP1SB08_9HEXA
MAKLQRIPDFSVEEISPSDYLPISALVDWHTTEAASQGKKSQTIQPAAKKVRWVNEKAVKFRVLSETFVGTGIEKTPGAFYYAIASAIASAAYVTNMTYTGRPMKERNNKPWFHAGSAIAKKHYALMMLESVLSS